MSRIRPCMGGVPSPLRGEGQGEGVNRAFIPLSPAFPRTGGGSHVTDTPVHGWHSLALEGRGPGGGGVTSLSPPPPCPLRGEGQGEGVNRAFIPLSPALPRTGGGSHVADTPVHGWRSLALEGRGTGRGC